MYHEYDEEEVEQRFGREGGRFLLEDGIIDTDDIEEIKKFKRKIEEEEIEKVEGRGSFNIIKVKERRDNNMDDSAFNDEENLKDLIEEFLEEEIDENFSKALKEMPEKLKGALEEAYKILVEYKADMIPELLAAVKLLGRLATGKPDLPSKYPYPSKKVKKSMPWSQVQDLLFGGHIRGDDEEIEKSSKENPFPSITRAIKIKKEAIDEIEEEMEEGSNYDDEDE